MKKNTAKKTLKKSFVEELSESQIKLLHSYNELNNRLNATQLDNTSLHFQMGVLKKENYEIKHLLQSIGSNINALRDINDPGEEKETESAEAMSQIKKHLPIHDDVMTNCEVCGGIHHFNLKTCPKCGFKKS